MADEKELIEDLVAGGIIGAALGALVSNDKDSLGLGAMIGAAIVATYNANQRAQQTKVPVLIKKGNSIYEIQQDGSKKLVKKLPAKTTQKVPKTFSLK